MYIETEETLIFNFFFGWGLKMDNIYIHEAVWKLKKHYAAQYVDTENTFDLYLCK